MSSLFSPFNDHFVMVSYLLITAPLTYAVALTKYHIITSDLLVGSSEPTPASLHGKKIKSLTYDTG